MQNDKYKTPSKTVDWPPSKYKHAKTILPSPSAQVVTTEGPLQTDGDYSIHHDVLSSARTMTVKEPVIDEGPIPKKAQAIFALMEHAFISQKTNYQGCLSCCSYKQKFRVNVIKHLKSTSQEYEKVFKCVMQNNMWKTYCTYPDSRKICMELAYNNPKILPGSRLKKNVWEPFLRLQKDSSCCLACCGKSVLRIEYVHPKEQKMLGYIVNCSKFGQITYELYKSSDSSLSYTITATKCQCGFFCKYTFGYCNRVVFDIIGSNGALVGETLKVWPGCSHDLLGKIGNMALRFPTSGPWEDKAMLVMCGLYLTAQYFEDSPGNPMSNCCLCCKSRGILGCRCC